MTDRVRVFVVDDDEAILEGLEAALEDGGFLVVKARSGEEAIRMLDSEGLLYKAIVTDINMLGQLTGWDVARHGRKVNDQIAIIYMTGASAHEWASNGVPNSLLMSKPFAAIQLLTGVSQLINMAASHT